jgi:biotin carboxylase
MTAGTDAGQSVAEVAAVFGLPASTPAVAQRVRDKAMMRQIMHLPHPWYRVNWNGSSVQLPCIVKPADASASRGITRCTSAAQLDEALKKARAANHASADVLIEEELWPHEEASTDWLVLYGAPIYVNGVARWFHDDPFAVEAGWINPFSITHEIVELAVAACERLGVTEGPFKMDIIKDARYGWCLLETATRWSGSFDHTVGAKLATGRDLTKALVDYSVGLPTDLAALTFNKMRFVAMYAPILREGEHTSEQMLRTLKAQPHVEEVIATKPRAGTVETLADRPLFMFASGATQEEARRNAEEAWRSWREEERTMNLGGGDE